MSRAVGPAGNWRRVWAMNWELILLDLDGTLMDSAPGIVASVRHAYNALELEMPTDDQLRGFVGPPMQVSAVKYGVSPERLDDFITAYRTAFTSGEMYNNSVYPGIVELLTQLAAAGKRLAVATSKPEVFAKQICDRFELSPLVEGVFGASLDTSRASKALVIEHALKTLSQTPDGVVANDKIIMVGDREHDVFGAREHGIQTIGVSWGYADDGELAEAEVDHVVTTPSELCALLLN